MANGFGVSFLPGPAGRETPGVNTDVSPDQQLQTAIKILSLRLPRVAAGQPLAPAPLLTSPGASGQPPGMIDRRVMPPPGNPLLEAILRLSGSPSPRIGVPTPPSPPMPYWPAPSPRVDVPTAPEAPPPYAPPPPPRIVPGAPPGASPSLPDLPSMPLPDEGAMGMMPSPWPWRLPMDRGRGYALG